MTPTNISKTIQSRHNSYGIGWFATAFIDEARVVLQKLTVRSTSSSSPLPGERARVRGLFEAARPFEAVQCFEYQGIRRVIATAAISLTVAGAASACSVCFGDPNDAQSHGMNMAILTLLGVTGGVMTTIVAFGTTIALRIRRAELAAEMGETP